MTSTLSDRIRNPWFVGGIGLLSLWVGGAICLFLGRRSSLQPDGQCFIGIKVWTDITLVVIDFTVNAFLTAGFIQPVLKCGFSKSRHIVKYSLIIAILSFATSAANILVMLAMHGHQQVYVCLGACTADVSINACLLFFLTNASEETPPPSIAPTFAVSGKNQLTVQSPRAMYASDITLIDANEDAATTFQSESKDVEKQQEEAGEYRLPEIRISSESLRPEIEQSFGSKIA